ncbi:hypothetical protein PUNSTDRAFT_97766 [Punctularia strigosozonata HHB-11173 SS5]|uniref:uncharacterized protein n=1 Tax=Punctularia strigosozonata (strain HHB-11173) TaxID=741275 RepID=UPI00044177B7|nr:uncharacterized protein PUNSTDRAFT_97766 [Punctularia strigosozonata HHB-11173 SS5]EIN12840.1 hypothetical protein PUNSTDRAFT_97766 [Punctularia strigosozonata HHB-11173 SS5]
MASLKPILNSLLRSLPPGPIDKAALDSLVRDTLSQADAKSSPENRKTQWEYLLKEQVLTLASNEGGALDDPDTTYYDQLRDMLDVVLTFTEQDACDPTFPFTTLQDLIETHTIASCSHLFSWIESRANRLTAGMVPQKGKALVLLRMLNDLLRRLSKMGDATVFCGRILSFLSAVFPLGERSGVNLRGEYGPTWEGVMEAVVKEDGSSGGMDVDEKMKPPENALGEPGDTKMQVDEENPSPSKSSSGSDDFYSTFWFLQLPFSKPPVFAEPGMFARFKTAVNKVLPVIHEANAKERLLIGSSSKTHAAAVKSQVTPKRKRDAIDTDGDEEDVGTNDYFFAKFLTSPELLDLEIADSHFRRQFLFQLLILLQHLQTFTRNAKAAWYTPRNRSLQMDFTLETADPNVKGKSASDLQWVSETMHKAIDELRQTAPNGRGFSDTVRVILERERNWVRWKNELCAPFDREPWAQEIEEETEDDSKERKRRRVGLEEATAGARKKMQEDPPEWPHALGSEALTEIWEMGYRDLDDLQRPFHPDDPKVYAKRIQMVDKRIEMRKKQLEARAEQEARELAKVLPAIAPIPAASPTHAPSPAPASTSQTSSAPASQQTDVQMSEPIPQSTAHLAATSPPLHPSLPAKPGTLTVPTAPPKPAVSTPTVEVPPPAPVPSPVIAVPVTATPTVETKQETPKPDPKFSSDSQLAALEQSKQRWAWLALRGSRDTHLAHFAKIGTGDVLALVAEIEKSVEKEKEAKDIAERRPEGGASIAGEERDVGSPATVVPEVAG